MHHSDVMILGKPRGAGLRPPADPPADADPLDVAMFYVRHWEVEFVRARRVVKKSASNVVLAGSTATGTIAVVGAATTVTGWVWLGVVTAALAGLSGVLSAMDGLHRHRDLWVQRSLALGRLQALKRNTEMRIAWPRREPSAVGKCSHARAG